MWEYKHTDELYHYGVPGMKWGVRKNKAIVKARKDYKQAVKEERKAKIKRAFSPSTYVAGGKNRDKSAKTDRLIKKLTKAREKAAFKAIDLQAKEAYKSKLAKTGNKTKAEKASIKVHAKAMDKKRHGAGLSGSIADSKKGNQNVNYYNHLKASKGKTYADKVEKKLANKYLTATAVAAAYGLGVTIYNAYSLYNNR